MAWKMSAAKRRALVKLQLRDKNGRWIEMGRGVKWYSSKRKKEIGGTVVGSQGNYALVRLNKENPTHEPALVKVPAHNIEVVSSKATLSKPNEKSNLETPEFEEPEAVAKDDVDLAAGPSPSVDAATIIPNVSDNKDDYAISDTSDGNTYISRKDGEQLYFPARALEVGDELLAPDGADETKPFSIGKAWGTKDAERLNTAGPKLGKVVHVEGDRYAVVQMAGGHTVDDRKNPGEQTDLVTVGLSNRVIKATPGLKEALGDKLAGEEYAARDEEEQEIDPESPDAQSDHVGREVPEDQQDQPELPPLDDDEDEYKETIVTLKATGNTLDEIQFAIETAEGSGYDHGLRMRSNGKIEVYDIDGAIKALQGPLDTILDNYDPVTEKWIGTIHTAKQANAIKNGLSKIINHLKDLKAKQAEKEANNKFLNGYDIDKDRELGKVVPNSQEQDYVVERTSIALLDSLPVGSTIMDMDPERRTAGMPVVKLAQNRWAMDRGLREYKEYNDGDLYDDSEQGIRFPDHEQNDFSPEEIAKIIERLDRKRAGDKAYEDMYKQRAEEQEAAKKAAEEPVTDEPAQTEPEVPETPADEPEVPSETPEEEYNENGLTADEQRTADALARMADKSDERGDFDKSDYLMKQYMDLMKKGQARKAQTPTEKPQEPAEEPKQSTPNLVEPTDPETPEDSQKFEDKPKPQLPPLEDGEELELPIPGLKKQGKRADKSAQHLKTLDGLEKGDRVSYTNAHDETFTYQKHEDGTWDLLDPEDEWEDESPLEEALTAEQVAQRHKRGDLEVSTVADQEEALREERYKNTDERGNDYFKNNPDAVRRKNNGDEGKSKTEQEQQDSNSADQPWSVSEIQGTMAAWFDFAQAVKNGDSRAIETMANRKRTGDEETDIIVNDKGQPFDLTLTYNDDGDPVVRLSNFDDSKDIYGDFDIDTSVMPKHLATLIHESINADDVRAAIAERNGSADRELDERENKALEEVGYVKPVLSRYVGHAKGTLQRAIENDPESGIELDGNDVNVRDLDKAQDFLRDVVNETQRKIDDPKASGSFKITANRALRDLHAILKEVNQKQFDRDGKLRPHKSIRDDEPAESRKETPAEESSETREEAPEEAPSDEATPEETPEEAPAEEAPEESTPEEPAAKQPTDEQYRLPEDTFKPYDGSGLKKTAAKVEEDGEHPLDKLGVQRRTPEALPNEKYPPTQQQQDVIDAVLGGLDTLVQAKAGAGKTTTLQAIAERVLKDRPDEQILYVAFNKTVQEEATTRMPSNVEPRTGHSISFNWVPTKMRERFKDEKSLQLPKDIAKHLGISGRGEYHAEDMASDVMTIVGRYSFSADDEVGLQHIPDHLEDHDDKTKAALVAYAKKAWADIINHNEGKLKIEQDHMRKLWALSRPDFSKLGGGVKPSQIVFIDEAQDTPPVLAKVIADQKIQKVVVGDADQAIYGFTGATDYLSQAEGDVELPLNMSWRFGPEVASVGNRFLELLGSEGRVVGGGPSSEIVTNMQDADAILVRSNSGMLGEIIRELERGRVVGISEKTMADMRALIATARWLKFGAKPAYKPKNMHEKLAPYRKWEEVVAAANKGGDQSLTSLKNMVEEYGVARLKELMDKVIVDKKLEEVPEGGRFADKLTFVSNPTSTIVEGKPWDTVAAKDMLKSVGFRYLPIPGQSYQKGDKKGEPKKAWTAVGTPEEQAAMVEAFRKLDTPEAALENYVKPDVIVSTAHKAKGLEWDRVRIGDDFWQPKVDEETGELVEMVEDDELRLAYVAVTRAQKALDVGSLGYVYQYTSENGGTPKSKVAEEPRELEDTDQPTKLEPDTTPEDHSFKEPEETGFDEPVEQAEPEEVEPEVAEPEEVEPEVTEPEPTKPVNVGMELDWEGLTPAERRHADDLEQRVADVYRGNSNEDVKELENELFDLYRTGLLRNEGEDIPETQPRNQKPAEPEVTEPEVTEPVEPEVVEPVVEEPVEEPVVEEPAKVQPPAQTRPQQPEYDDEGLTPEERRRADQLEKWISDIYKGVGQGNRQKLDKELQAIYDRGDERLKQKTTQKPKPVTPKPTEPTTPVTPESRPETPEPAREETDDERNARTRRNFADSDRVVTGGDGSEIRPNSTGVHRKLGKVQIVDVQPGSNRLTFIDPITGKVKSAKAEFITSDTSESTKGKDTPSIGGEPFVPADTPVGGRVFDPEQNKDVFISANKQKVAIGGRVKHAKKGYGTVRAIYPGADKLASVRVVWDDGSDNRVKGSTLDGEDSPFLSNEAGKDWEKKTLEKIFAPEAEPEEKPLAPEESTDDEYGAPTAPTEFWVPADMLLTLNEYHSTDSGMDGWDKALKMYNYLLNTPTFNDKLDEQRKNIKGSTYLEAKNLYTGLKKHYEKLASSYGTTEHKEAAQAVNVILKKIDSEMKNPVDRFNTINSSMRHKEPLSGWERTDLIMSSKDKDDPLRILEEGVIQDSYRRNTVVSLLDKQTGKLIGTYQKNHTGSWVNRDKTGAVVAIMAGQFPVMPDFFDYKVDENPNGERMMPRSFPRSSFWNNLPVGARVEVAALRSTDKPRVLRKVRDGLWYNEDLKFHTAISGQITRPLRVLEAEGVEVEETRPVGSDTYGAIPRGHARNKLLKDAPAGSQFTYSDSPESVYVKEDDGTWSERISGIRTGNTFTSASSDADLNKNESPDIIVRLPKGLRVEDLIDSSLDESKFDIDTYDGQDVDFSDFDFESSKFNPASSISQANGQKNDAVVSIAGETFYTGARVFDKNGTSLGKIGSVIQSTSSPERNRINIVSDTDKALEGRSGKWYGADEVRQMGLRGEFSPEYGTEDIDYDGIISVFDLQAALKKKYPGQTFQFTGISIEVAKEYARTVERMLSKFPQLRHSLHKVVSEHFGDYPAGAVALNRSDNWSARSVAFNSKNLEQGVDSYRRFVQQSGARNLTVKAPAGREVEYMMTHEFGHIIDYLTKNIDERRILELISKALGRKVTENNKALRDELLRKKLVSEYSTRGTAAFRHMNKGAASDVHIVELVAESFADVELNGTKASPISKLVHKELMDKLKEY